MWALRTDNRQVYISNANLSQFINISFKTEQPSILGWYLVSCSLAISLFFFCSFSAIFCSCYITGVLETWELCYIIWIIQLYYLIIQLCCIIWILCNSRFLFCLTLLFSPNPSVEVTQIVVHLSNSFHLYLPSSGLIFCALVLTFHKNTPCSHSQHWGGMAYIAFLGFLLRRPSVLDAHTWGEAREGAWGFSFWLYSLPTSWSYTR